MPNPSPRDHRIETIMSTRSSPTSMPSATKASSRTIPWRSAGTTPIGSVAGRTMAEHLRFAVCYWHSFNWDGFDIFGAGTLDRPWLPTVDPTLDPMVAARSKMDAAFEFVSKLGVPFYCFHDRDIAPEGATFAESCRNLDEMVDLAGEHQERTGVKLLWGTANLFSNPRFQAGAATNPDPELFAFAAAQIAHCMDVDAPAGRRELRAVGRARGLRDAAQHRHAARDRPARPVLQHGRRAQARDRVRGHDPHRAEAVRADQAPVRLRRRRRALVPAPATGSRTR